ncbi:uncharacterized protein N0V89_008723 [Didymosphaeria variabile]|uniref:AA1-like domain-containing protein n=1 Tax=Didymosphaeria variabile TaxID=1932322 RepID=A0A9W8XI35_9PLEO|nr:uncharacterized protein N0V89_008723 [Didymosphaeria variabile]KAJ4350102.1 hypothetical protein N0V89_008723 [Didymosphaeria variabile]
MHLTAALLSLSAVASSAAVTPRAEYGYWDFKGSVSFPASGYTSYSVEATYHNSELADPIDVTCNYLYSPPTQTTEASCSDPSFSYDFGDVRMADTVANVTLQQTVGLWGENVTVIGVKEFDWDFSSGSGRSGTAEGKIEVTTAVA